MNCVLVTTDGGWRRVLDNDSKRHPAVIVSYQTHVYIEIEPCARGYVHDFWKPTRPSHSFALLPRRWVLERKPAWLNRNRRRGEGFRRYDRTRDDLARHRHRQANVTPQARSG
jgi:hypothetical protein